MAVAKKNNKQSFSLMGADGFNNSFLTLAINESTGKMPDIIYEDGETDNCLFTSD